MSVLVIVESPTKAKTIKDFLPKGYEVIASMGHVRDLPQSAADIPEKVKKEKWAQMGVNWDKDFEPLYVVPKEKQKTLKEIKAKLKVADELILATDEDREGESISWHLLDLLQGELKNKTKVKRMVFHEITKEAILEALENTREVNMDLVHAQETRRIMDRLVGYTLSPLLWKKVAPGLSAGRVQSVSVRLLVLKERERMAFKKGSYWDLSAKLDAAGASFEAQMVELAGQKLATGADFDETTGQIKKGKKVLLLNEKEARETTNRLGQAQWKVVSMEEKQSIKKPSPPFITSTLQQEANRKLKLSPRQAMQVAQALYEKGFITYMRTDSVSLSDQALKAAQKGVTQLYGKEYLAPKPRQFASTSKGAQEAHEAIRPAGAAFQLPEKTGLKGLEFKLYDLIWKRTIATQMADAQVSHVTARIQADDCVFRASGKKIIFPGFFRAYVEGSDDPTSELENKEVILPDLKEGTRLGLTDLTPQGHETKPPARYSEASLVKKLETEGIGRPSTYATIIDTIQDRGYVRVINHSLVPTFVAFAVVDLLENHFAELVDPGFTSTMEGTLDQIAQGEQEWLPYMKKFYLGDEGLMNRTQAKTDQIDAGQFRHLKFPGMTTSIAIGRFGPYLEQDQDGERITASIPQDMAPADLDQEQADLILGQKQRGNEELGIHPEFDLPIYLLNGAYGAYVQLGEVVEGEPKPKRVTLPKGMKESDVTMETAMLLLSLPRTLGEHPEGGKIKVGISRFGSYVVWERNSTEKDFRSLPKEESIIEVDLARAMELLQQEKRGRKKGSDPLRDLGPHPEDGQTVQLFNGPYGPYVKHGKTNASVPKDHPVEEVTLEEALGWLGEKKGKKPVKRGKGRAKG